MGKLSNISGNSTSKNSTDLTPNFDLEEIPEYNATLPEILEIVKNVEKI